MKQTQGPIVDKQYHLRIFPALSLCALRSIVSSPQITPPSLSHGLPTPRIASATHSTLSGPHLKHDCQSGHSTYIEGSENARNFPALAREFRCCHRSIQASYTDKTGSANHLRNETYRKVVAACRKLVTLLSADIHYI